VNDAPALAAAHVGIAVLTATDISMHVSDLLLTTDRIEDIAKFRSLAIKTHAIIKQNLFWAFFYNGIGLILAAFGFLTPLFASFAMIASSFMILMNTQRIQR
jgi:P-type E1-E2 ATPase